MLVGLAWGMSSTAALHLRSRSVFGGVGGGYKKSCWQLSCALSGHHHGYGKSAGNFIVG